MFGSSQYLEPLSLPSTALIFFLTLLVPLLHQANAASSIALPPTTGKYALLHRTMLLTDPNRLDIYAPSKENRRVMTSIFHPVPNSSCTQTCLIPYMPRLTADLVQEDAARDYKLPVPDGLLASLGMRVCCGCDLKKRNAEHDQATGFPLVIFSPGLGGTRLLYNQVLAELASRGYTVVSVDHTYETPIVEFPDGSSVTGLNGSFWDPQVPGRLEELLAERVKDVRFVLGELGRRDVVASLDLECIAGCNHTDAERGRGKGRCKGKWKLAGKGKGWQPPFNMRKATIFGHSFGGATSIATLAADNRFLGGLDMDGTLFLKHLAPNDTITQPVMLWGRADPNPHNSTNDESWASAWPLFTGWKREIGLQDSGHLTFGDTLVVFDTFGLGKLPLGDDVKALVGWLTGERAIAILGTWLEGFMAMVGKDQDDGWVEKLKESGDWPELVVKDD